MTNLPGYSIESVDLQPATNAEIQEIAQFRQDLALEQKPEDPPTPIEVITQWLRARPPGQWRVVFVARDRDLKLAGYGVGARNLKDTQNAHIRWSEIAVKPEHRRRGLGRALFAHVLGSFKGQGDELTVISETTDRVPSGEAFAQAIGAKPGLPMKMNQLDLAAVDRRKVREWSEAAPKGYRPEAQGGDARTHPRPAARLAFHQDGERQRERPDARDQREAGLHLRVAEHALAAADGGRTQGPRGSRSPRESLSTKT